MTKRKKHQNRTQKFKLVGVFNEGSAEDRLGNDSQNYSMESLIRHANETVVSFCEAEVNALIDSGSKLTTICEEYFNAMTPSPTVIP